MSKAETPAIHALRVFDKATGKLLSEEIKPSFYRLPLQVRQDFMRRGAEEILTEVKLTEDAVDKAGRLSKQFYDFVFSETKKGHDVCVTFEVKGVDFELNLSTFIRNMEEK